MSANNMNSSLNNEDEPLDPAVERVRRKVMRLMGISIAIMMIGLMAVIGAIFYKISRPTGENIATSGEPQNSANLSQPGKPGNINEQIADLTGNIELPAGSTIINAQLGDGQILLNVKSAAGGHSFWVYDLAAARVFARVTVKPASNQ
jgi:hypothetical protein